MGNRLLRYSRYFHSQRAWWHVHTRYTDGRCSVKEIFELAVVRHIEFICFIEHVRPYPSYSVEALRTEVARYGREYGVQAALGFEVKLLRGGMLNIPQGGLDGLIFLAEHGAVADIKEEYVSTLVSGLRNAVVNGWVHPGLFAKKKGWTFSDVDLERIASVMREKQLVYEVNKRYGLPVSRLSDFLEAAGVPCFTGIDFHSEEDLE
jgi:histidinol phosphatase-like PHP family hydrolase